MSMLKYISPLVVENDAPDELLDFPVFSTTHSEKIKKIETHLKTNQLENLDDFARLVDREIFQRRDKRVVGMALLFSLFGLMPSSPSCGYLMDNVATFLGIPPNHASATGLISYIMIATTPAFLLEYSSYQPFFEKLYVKILMDAATLPTGSCTNHLAKIVHFAGQVDNFIIHADVLTTETLWRILNAQKADA